MGWVVQYYCNPRGKSSITFGNGLLTSCVVNIGAQLTFVLCIEDRVVIPTIGATLPSSSEDISWRIFDHNSLMKTLNQVWCYFLCCW